MSIDRQKTTQEIFEERKKLGVIKELPLSSGIVLRVKMPSPKVLDEEFHALRREINQQKKGKDDPEIDVENGLKLRSFYMDKLEAGLLDGADFNLLTPDEYAEIEDNILDFFGKTVKKDGMNSQSTQNGEKELTDSHSGSQNS